MPLAFTLLDWGVLGAYLLLMAAIGTWAARKKTDAEGYFLAERKMPTWAVALSIIATSLSVATFVGVPQESFTGDLSYLSLTLGGFVGVFIVAILFIPRLYRAGTVTIYGFIDKRLGGSSRIAVSSMFLFGRLLSSGARLFIAAIPTCLLIWGASSFAEGKPFEPTQAQIVKAILLIGAVGTAYTVFGGIRAVIWTDTAQILIVMGAAVVSIALLLHQIPLPLGGIWHTLANSPGGTDGHSKLRLFNMTLDATTQYTIWTALIGNTFLMVAAYGVDHDLAQRMLTARSPMRGSLSLVTAQVLGLVVVGMFMVLGLLLWIYYRQPDVMKAAAPLDRLHGSDKVYPQFLLNHMSTGLAGLAMAGMLAAAQGSLDSAINAMASSAVADLYWPIRRRMGRPVDTSSRTSRVAVLGIGAVLILFAIGSSFYYKSKDQTLIQFALSIMSFAYTGMLGVFLTALLTRRGNGASVLAALATGLVVTTLLQDKLMAWWTLRLLKHSYTLSNFWWMPIGTVCSFLVCICGGERVIGHRVISDRSSAIARPTDH